MKIIERQKGENGHAIVKRLLLEFWDKFGGKSNRGVGFSKEGKIAELIELANTKVSFHMQQPVAVRREDFDETKAKLHPFRRFGVCFACHRWATARHHIIQLQHGGLNSKKNLVSLCDSCHAEVHPWLNAP